MNGYVPAFLLLLSFLIVVLALFFYIRLRRSAPQAIEPRLEALEKGQERAERALREEMARNRDEAAKSGRDTREELTRALRDINESLLTRVAEASTGQKSQLEIFTAQLHALTAQNIQKLDRISETVDSRLKGLQEENALRLEQMRATVDEKLHDTLEKRLGDSFRIVSERLEQVHKGLGEMQTLATGVGDLKRVLTNVKTRGIFGEIQLGNLLEQMLTPDQYEANVVTKAGSAMRVEFAVKLPGRDGGQENLLWLPIDAKFPQEDYLRLLDAQEKGDAAAAEEACRQLDRAVREMARNIRDKYLDPPAPTDFGIMFLPTEGLYAEVLRRTGLCETLHRDFRVVVAGPMTLTAILNSLQMGFLTLAIEKRSSEVWTLLGAVKTEFTKFGDILDRTHKKLREASDTIEDASRKTRTIERKLRAVQELPAGDGRALLDDSSGEPDEDHPPQP